MPFLELPHGIPDSNTFRRVFGRIAPEALSKYLYDWLGCHWERSTVVAIDGKTIWGIKSKIHKAHHVVSAFAAENQMAIGELVTEEKSNEVTAVPDLLDALNVAGSIVTADATSCQKSIVPKIQDSQANYVIGLKGNQPALLEDISLYFQEFSRELPGLVTRDKDHGRIEKRKYRLLTILSWLPESSEWAGLKAVGCVCSTVTRNGATSTDTCFFITSLTDINRFSYVARKHWSIENQLHWSLDVIFEEDSSRVRKKYVPPST